jgi:hypothetical protein
MAFLKTESQMLPQNHSVRAFRIGDRQIDRFSLGESVSRPLYPRRLSQCFVPSLSLLSLCNRRCTQLLRNRPRSLPERSPRMQGSTPAMPGPRGQGICLDVATWRDDVFVRCLLFAQYGTDFVLPSRSLCHSNHNPPDNRRIRQ